MNINQLKYKLRKIKPRYGTKTFILTALKENAPLYVDGAGLTNNQQNKKEDTSMNYFPKTAYWRILLLNAESAEKTTNPYFKIYCAPSLEKK